MNKNLEFKILSGLEIIVKLEHALKYLDQMDATGHHESGIDVILNIKKSAIPICDLTKDDFESMNKQKIEML
jgi:hypothetical protein